MMQPKRKLDPAKLRTRFEPPTLTEAVFAAQGLTSDSDQQVRIAARLIGLPEDEVRPAVLKARSPAGSARLQIAGMQRPVTVERKGRRPSMSAAR
jgi:hypothetical protein